MYYKHRGGRGGKKLLSSSVGIIIPDDVQLERTLGLIGVDGDKPCINDLMCIISKRIEEEEKAAQAEYVRRWYEKYGEDGYGECMFYDCMGEDDFPDDDYPYYGLSKKELKKLYGRKGKKKKGKRHRHYDDEMEDDVYSNVDSEWKEINFYEDIENELSVIQFSSIKEFSDYCEEQGIKVGNVDGENLMNWDRIHCCLDPLSLKYGEKDLITDTSYGGLYWTVADDVDADGVAAV